MHTGDEELNFRRFLEWSDAIDLAADPILQQRVRWVMLDTFACAVFGLRRAEVASLQQRLKSFAPGSAEIPGMSCPLNPQAAAYVLAVAACWDEVCEGHEACHGRPALHAAPACLALGWSEGLTLGQCLNALFAGYEIGARLGEALRVGPNMHVDGTWGTVGASLAVATLLGLDFESKLSVLNSAACVMTRSLFRPVEVGSPNRVTYAAAAVERAFSVTHSTAAGLWCPDEMLAAADLGGAIRVTEELVDPSVPYVHASYFKEFPCARHVHYAITAALAWLTRNNLRRVSTEHIPDISKITLETYPEAARYCANASPTNTIQAQFSLRFGIACALVRGEVSHRSFCVDNYTDADIMRLSNKIAILPNDRQIGRFAALSIEFAGRRSQVLVDSVKGDSGTPFTELDVATKAEDLISETLDMDSAKKWVEHFLASPLDAPVREPS